jgi:AcrR family transcriptional regulator
MSSVFWYIYQMPCRFSLPCFAALQPDASAREKILTAATELLFTKGFSAITQQAVAAVAGVRQSHLTYYFPTRNDLLRAMAQHGVETMLIQPMADVAAGTSGPPTLAAFRQLMMPDRADRQWFRLMVGLLVASDEDASIRDWLREFDARIVEKLGVGLTVVGVHLSLQQLHFLHATFVGALHLDMQEQTDTSFARMERTVAMALDMLLPTAPHDRTPVHMPPIQLNKVSA